jgi:hypothetical protein
MILVPLSSASWIIRTAGVLDADLGDEVIATHIETNQCVALNPVASLLWRRIVGPVCVAELCAQLVVIFDVDPVTCETQVLALLEELRGECLITTTTQPGVT